MPIDIGSAQSTGIVAGQSASGASRRLFDSYRPMPGVPDELCDARGQMRPVWAGLIEHLSAQRSTEIEARFARGERHLADAGVFFRKYGDDSMASREWPFSPVPVVLHHSDWAQIAQGLTQRATLLEALAADLYGPNRLVADGHLPGAIIADSPEWLRPMVGTAPRGGHFLHFCAFEIGRGPDGHWWVLSDLTDAPSGAGFALENRVTAATVFPELYASTPVRRLAGFYQGFRDALTGLSKNPAARTAILTPGPMNDTYFEQAYIARYLGMPLLEGGDLMVSDGALFMRTVKGPVPVEVLWRRMDSVWSDPLELRGDSHLGTAGLVSAVRAGSATMVNALGAGILETQALMAFMPNISRVLLGQDLAMPNVATWWCGGPGEKAHVAANLDRMMIGPALATRLPFENDAPFAIGGKLQPESGADVHSWLETGSAGLVAKEMVTLSTTPVYENGMLVPRPMTLRVFLARTPDGWQVMPGGFARIGARADNRALSLQHGGTVADVWIIDDRPAAPISLLPAADAVTFRRAQPSPLPSRAADNLFWLGRYVERSEGLMRLLRAYHGRLGEGADELLLKALIRHLKRFGHDFTVPVPAVLHQCLGHAIRSASQIRDRFSVDAWAALNDLEKTATQLSRRLEPGTDAAHGMSILLRKIAGLSGLTHENMYRAAGWQFLTIGRALERAAMMAQLLIDMADADAVGGGLDLVIEVGDSVMTHRQRYAIHTSRSTVIDQLALDDLNPRSIRFQLDAMLQRTVSLTADMPPGQITDFERQLRMLQTQFTVHSVESLTDTALRDALAAIHGLSDTVNAAFLL